ncbi:MAG: hypothetical protein M3T56_00995 [Chloroflexota bacterium]|nr:hypothetical protein [Chloroflexota bacterium]
MLIASGLFHVGVFLVRDGGWAGPISWRKPIEFGISGGVTTLSLAAVMSRLPRTGWLAWPCAVAIALFVPETVLIDLQTWRGLPSHFNFDTGFDAAVFSAMGTLIAFVSLAIVAMTIWSLTSLRGPGSSVLAIRAGMVSLTIGQLLGFALLGNGFAVGDVFRASIVGAAGDLKVPHAVALHGLQVLGLLALILERSRLPESRRSRIVIVATAGYAAALGVAVIQAFGGRGPVDLSPLSLLGAIAAVVLLFLAYVSALRAAGSGGLRWDAPAN